MKKRFAHKIAVIYRRIQNEETGAVAMEYIVITLLVAAACVALIMVLGGNLRNMLATTNKIMTATTTDEINLIATDYFMDRENMKYQNDVAIKAGNLLGGAFAEPAGGYCEVPPGYY